ncbi:acyltransferase family protein [Frondihabitans sp. Leaf304]|uniref:acyltransferase family protein n=1 Tax=Frondihabitans sp. Leaf304 TaxID=1736329 RepID=UPI0007006820|nr:acyltransferase family protein [Frondihabitans sp. Leaf304]KQQ26581.1 hypothetical protein ASF54_11315 [Frondihabitans sp. Leaf304]
MPSLSRLPQRPTAPGHRSDIQVLRAVAVVAVFADHLLAFPGGGFLGVDVFFVLSGFLITGLLLREHASTGRISLRRFFVRRVKRLAPAALLVLGVTVAVSALVFNAVRASSILTDALWASLFGANWRFGSVGTDYFAADTPVSPLQHFWSLSVEEQFYLVWPLALILLLALGRAFNARGRTALVAGGLAALVAASFVCALVTTGENLTSAYFSTFARAWEIGAGALLATLTPLLGRIPDRVRPALGFLGCAGILGSFVMIDEAFPVPGPWSLAPVIATLVVLAAGTGRADPDLAVVPFETNRVVGYVGDISYSLYLWHFPVIIVLASVLPSGPFELVAAAVLSIGFAIGSYHLVERPLLLSPLFTSGPGVRARWRSWLADVRPTYRRGSLGLLAGLAVILSGAAVVGSVPVTPALPPELAQASETEPDASTAGPDVTALQKKIEASLKLTSWPTTDPSIEQVLAGDTGADAEVDAAYHCSAVTGSLTSTTDPACSFGPSDAPKTAFVVGDSMAAFGFPGLADIVSDPKSGWKLQNVSKFACPYVDLDVSFDGTEDSCLQHKEAVLDAIRSAEPDMVIVSNAYTEAKDRNGKAISAADWDAATKRALTELAKSTDKLVILSPPPAEQNIKTCYTPSSTPGNCLSHVVGTWQHRAASDQALMRTLKGSWIDSRPLFCAYDLCPAVIASTVVRMDFNHITPGAAHLTSAALAELLRKADLLSA